VQSAILPSNGISKESPSHTDSSLKDVDNSEGKADERREELKQHLVKSAAEFSIMQKSLERAANEKVVDVQQTKKSGSYFWRLLLKIFNKVMGKKKKSKDNMRGGILSTKAFGTRMLEVGKAGDAIISIAEELSKLSPTSMPTYGWKGYGGGSPDDCKLGGKWKLIFTTAADASFSESSKRGEISTSQEVDPNIGTLTNVIDFERGKAKGFRVVVAGEAVADDEIELSFRRVEIVRESRFPRLFGRIVFPIPAKLFRLLNRSLSNGKASPRGPYFQLQYIDDDLRMHKTGEGNWFIQKRLG